MEIENQTILDLVKGQARIEQKLDDVAAILPPLEKRVEKVEKRVWWLSGVGSAIGFIVSHVGGKFIHGGR